MTMRLHIVVLTLLAAVGVSHADLLVLKDGDVLSGTVVRIRQHILVFRTSLAGQLTAPLDTVKTISTDAPLIITLDDGTLRTGRLSPQGGENQVMPLGAGAPVKVDLARIVEADVIPKNDAAAVFDAAESDVNRARELRVREMDRLHDKITEMGKPRARLHTRGFESPTWLPNEIHADKNDSGGSSEDLLRIELDPWRERNREPDARFGLVAGMEVDTTRDPKLRLGNPRSLFGLDDAPGAVGVLPGYPNSDAVRLQPETGVNYPLRDALRLRVYPAFHDDPNMELD